MEAKKYERKNKEFGVGPNLENALILFLANQNYGKDENSFQIFNEWSRNCHAKVNNLDTLINIISIIEQYRTANPEDLEDSLLENEFIYREDSFND